jgi:lysyl endopeptidase
MKKILFIWAIFSVLSIDAQVTVVSSFDHLPLLSLPKINREQLAQEDIVRDNQGILYRIGVAQFTNITVNNSGLWETNTDGSRTWKLRIKSEGAEALSFLFQTFKIYGESTFDVLDLNGRKVHNTLTKDDVQDAFTQNAALCRGDELILVLNEPTNTQPSEIHIDRVMHNYRSTGYGNQEKINESEACEVNVNCSPVGDSWQDEKRGVARIYVVESASAGWCTGSLINNTAQDCKPYFLTALHCGVTTSATNMTQWKFYFRYESPNCTNPSTAGTLDDYFVTGCLRIADSGDGGGDSGSDFLLVQLGSANNTSTIVTQLKSTNFNAYWNGWNANNTATTGGTGIHHPAGDIKKISTATGTTVSSGWNGNGLQSHWRTTWTANANGHGVTEGGSSGSPYFNNSQGYIVGTLTGGGSFCNATNQPDYYGKMSYHWTSNGTATNRQLKPWLDPTNSGALTLAGSNDPCTPTTPVPPVANFVANQTNVPPGTTVSFTDQSTGIPTSWSWTLSPATGWAYANGTASTSQNPQITFNTVGQYTVTLTATNAQGSDAETKTNYIIVAQATGPCTPSVTATCDEYIQNVTLNTINNTTACTSGGYVSYTSTSTSLAKGTQYTATITPAVGANIGQAYTNDEIAIWIDYNNDFTFSVTERVGYVLVGAGWSNQFTFTVPSTATTGAVRMRVRISYSVVADGGAPIDPCAVATYGETEDYTVNITQGGNVGLSELNENDVIIYPNPTNSNFVVEIPEVQNELVEIKLMDVFGRIITSKSIQKNNLKYEFSTNSISNGTYYIVIVTDSRTITKRVMKN